MENTDARSLWPDKVLFLIIVSLLVIGLAMVYSASTVQTLDAGVFSFYYFIKQTVAAVIGIVIVFFILKFDYQVLAEPKVYLTLLVLALILLIVVLYMRPIKGTHRWFSVMGVNFQPSEFAKLALLITLAAVSSRLKTMLTSWGFIFLTLAALVAPVVFLIAIEPDFGTAAVLTMASLGILFTAGIGMRKIFILMMLVLILVSVFIGVSDYRLNRIKTFLNPTEDPLGRGFQATQSEIALGSGGLLGVTFMRSKQKLFYLPEAHSDMIFSVIGEEWGMLGTYFIVFLYLALFARGMWIAFKARELFGFLLAVGLSILIVGQALMNISVAATLFPTKGIPLPLISYGGSSMIFSLVGLGILLNISLYCRKGN